MTETEKTEYIEHCLNILFEKYPDFTSLPHKFNNLKYPDTSKILEILEIDDCIERDYASYKLTKTYYDIYKKKRSYKEHNQQLEKEETRNEMKSFYEYEMAKLKYKTFWYIFGLAVFGGLYSGYSIIKDIVRPSKEELYIQSQNSIKEMESELSTLRTLILDQKMVDSLNHTKPMNIELKK